MIQNLTHINRLINNDQMDICVVSYGGSCSNLLADTLEKNNFKCKTKLWDRILCHCPKYIDIDIPIIYIYDDPIKAFLSVKRRKNGFWNVNQKKLSNNPNIKLSDETLLKLMIRQFFIWTNKKYKNVLVIKSDELFKQNIKKKLKQFLGIKQLKHFPLHYKSPKTNATNVTNYNIKLLLDKYDTKIKKIKNYKSNG